MYVDEKYIPLTVLFIDERGYVLEMKDMIPNTETHTVPKIKSGCLELETKWLKSTNIKSKSRITNLNSLTINLTQHFVGQLLNRAWAQKVTCLF